MEKVGGGDHDAVGLARDRELAVAVVMKVRGGALLGRDTRRFGGIRNEGDEALLASFASSYYLGGGERRIAELPTEVLLPGDFGDRETREEVLSDAAGRRVRLRVPRRGEKVRLIELAATNARHVLEDRVSALAYASDRADETLYELQDRLDLKVVPRLMVCFDVSHIQGSDTVGSAVVFENGEPRKSGYRHMRITGDEGRDDYRSMAQVVSRWFRRRIEEEERLPDLVLIDGGKGQLRAARRVLEELELPEVAVAALAKREEEVFLPGRSEPLRLDRRNRALHLLQRIRNEAHRFAVSYNRKLRKKRTIRSRLREIPGMGAPGPLRLRAGDPAGLGGRDLPGAGLQRDPGGPGEGVPGMIRTRFAPSPTGSLHLGNVRIAVFNWLFARHHGGRFVLRIEDTDVERNVEAAEEGILADLRWLGLQWDEGPDVGGPHGPYRQSERTEGYHRAARDLVERERAYPCYCTEEELDAMREEVGGGESVLRYSGRCRALTDAERQALEDEGRAHSIRFALPEGLDEVEIEDEVRGSISFPAREMDDFVILRSDGRPTYNFAVVVDDAAMEISHVIRGAGHLSNTPRQLLLFRALERESPRFAHLPTVLSPQGGKLSKREDAAAVGELRERGYLPEGVVNYLSLLGWSSPDGEEVLDPEELVERISLERVGAADTVYDPEKLRWMSGRHLARLDLETLTRRVEPFLDRGRCPLEGKRLEWAVDALRTRLSALGEIDEHLHLLYPEPGAALESVRKELREDPDTRALLQTLRERLVEVEPWDPEHVGRAVREAGKQVGARGPDLFHPVRAASSGSESGPDLGKVLAALGPTEVLSRLDETLSGTAETDGEPGPGKV